MNNRKDTIKTYVEIVAIALPAVVTIFATVYESISSKEVWSVVSLVFTIVTLVCSFVVLGLNISKDKQNQKTIKRLNDTIDYYCDGRRLLSNIATIEFLSEKLAYSITISKTFEVLSVDNNSYSFYISCDKYPESLIKSNEFYSNKDDIWIGLNMKVIITIGKGKDKRTYDNVRFVVTKEERNNISFTIFYQQLKESQPILIPIKVGDIMNITYSFTADTQFWGSYINRKIDFFGATTTVNLNGIKDNQYAILLVDMEGKATEMTGCRVTKEKGNVHIQFPQYDSLNVLKKSFFRIYWDADKIFGTKNLNSHFIGSVDPFWRDFD